MAAKWDRFDINWASTHTSCLFMLNICELMYWFKKIVYNLSALKDYAYTSSLCINPLQQVVACPVRVKLHSKLDGLGEWF